MRTSIAALALAACVLSLPDRAEAARPVGLGVAAGIALPTSSNLGDIDPALSWGFFVDIPIISTFTITPSTILYRIDPKNVTGAAATDVSLNFKFIIPLGPFEPFAGITAGITSTSDLQPHVGGVLGASFNIVSNLDIYASVNYRLTIDDAGNVSTWHIFAGPLFRFGQG